MPHRLIMLDSFDYESLISSLHDLYLSVYGSIDQHGALPPPGFFRERTTLAARNVDIRSINSIILDRLPGEARTYCSADTYSIESPLVIEHPNIPVEFLQLKRFRLANRTSPSQSGMPNHHPPEH